MAAAAALGYPVALKAAGGALRHRIDLGAVRLDLADADDGARGRTPSSARPFGPRGAGAADGRRPAWPAWCEVVEDPAFGPVVGFGLGGVATDLLGDRAWRPRR